MVLGFRQSNPVGLLFAWGVGLGTAWCQALDTLRIADKNVHFDKDKARLEAAQSEIVLFAKDWQGRQLSLADILAEQAGIETRRYGGVGSFQSVSLRGSSSAQVEVYMDDVPLHSAGGGPVDLGKLDPNLFEKIEVRKGIATAADGGHGMGGVIRLYTRAALNHYGQVQVTGSLGSHETQKEAVSWTSPSPNPTHGLKVFAALTRQGSQNDFAYLNRNQTPYNLADDAWTRRKNSAFHSLNGLGQVEWNGKRGRYRFQLDHQRYSGGLPGREGQETVSSGFSSTATQYLVQYEREEQDSSWSWGWRLAMNESNPEVHWTRADGIGWSIAGDSVRMVSHTEKNLAHAHMHSPSYAALGLLWKWQTHLTGSLENHNPSDAIPSDSPSPWENRRASLNLASDATGEWQTGESSAYILTVGLQGEQWTDRVEGAFTPFGESPAEYEKSNLEVSGRLGLRWQWKQSTSVFSNIGRYYHAPSLIDRFGAHYGILANPDLRPERGWNGELGLRRKWQGGFLEACLFRNETEDAIVYLQSANLIKPFNMDRLLAQGLEGMVNLDGPFDVGLALNGVWQRTENRSATYREGNAIPNQPNFRLHSQTTLPLFSAKSWSWKLEHRWDWRSEIHRDVANIQRIPPLSLHHALSTLQWRKRYTLQMGCQNLTDVFYEDVYSSFPYPGRTWQTTVNLIF